MSTPHHLSAEAPTARPAFDAPSGRRLTDAAGLGETRWRTASLLTLLTLLGVTAALVNDHLNASQAAIAAPSEGYYASVAHYQIAEHRLKEELRAIAAGEPTDLGEVRRRFQLQATRASLLTEPSELRSLLEAVPGYSETAARLAERQRQIAPAFERSTFTRTDAQTVLNQLRATGGEQLLNRLSNDVRVFEAKAKDDALRAVARRSRWVWAVFGLCWTALALWLLYAQHAARRYRAAAVDRQLAVDAMERAMAAKQRFLGMVNHEVRSPLQSIVTAAELLRGHASQPEDVAAVRRIERAVTVLQNQLRDLLTIAGTDSSALSAHAETFDFVELVNDVCADLADAAQSKGLALQIKVPDQPLVVEADPLRITQVLRNLVENAIRYTDRGSVTVWLEHDIGTAAPSSTTSIRFSVRDTGRGLPPRVAQHLLDPAAKFEMSADGTGIGLFVVRDVLKQLGGQAEISDGDGTGTGTGTGTAITITVPVHLRPEPPSNPSTKPQTVDPLKVLIVDDRKDVVIALSQLTQSLGHLPATANSATQAHELLAQTVYDAILIDLEMRHTDGITLAKDIRNSGGINANKDADANCNAMLILISAAADQSAGQQWPFDGFLAKPIDRQSLARLIGSQKPH